jgi:hypothetical protein
LSAPTKPFCFDTSSFIRAWHEAYPLDVVATFWGKLEAAIDGDVVITPDEVIRETKKRSDGLHDWLKGRDKCIVEIDEDIQDAVASLLQRYEALAKNRKGASAADPWVIATARVREAIVVSEEALTDSEKRPKIPGVCKGIGVECINLLEFMRRQGWKI